MEIRERIAEKHRATIESQNRESSFMKQLAITSAETTFLDTVVKNSLSKQNGAAFELALKNGGIYKQYSFGNLITGSSPLDIFPGFKGIKSKMFSSDLFNFSFKKGKYAVRYFDPTSVEGTEAGEEFLKRHGTKNIDDVVSTGVGFGKNYKGFFKALNEADFKQTNVIKDGKLIKGGFNVENLTEDFYRTFNNSEASKIEKIFQESRKIHGKNFLKIDGVVAEGSYADTIKKGIARIIEHQGINIKDAKAVAEVEEVVRKTTNKELASVLGKKFAKRGLINRITGNTFTKVITGAYLGSSSLGITLGLTAASMSASLSQDNSIDEYSGSKLERHRDGYSQISEEGISGNYKHSNFSRSNDIDLQSISSTRNVAKRHLADLDIMEDETNDNYKNFSIY